VNQVLTPEYLAGVIAETKKHLDSTEEIQRQIQAEQRRLEDLEIAIERTLNTIERTGSQAAQDRLTQREAERAQVKGKIDQLTMELAAARLEITPEAMTIILAAWRDQLARLQETGSVRELKAWILQFVARVELGYNTAKIFYTYPLKDILSLQNAFPLRGGTKRVIIGWLFFYSNPGPR